MVHVMSKLLSRSVNYVAESAASSSKSLTDIPTPKGALPILGHYLQIRGRKSNLSTLYEAYFKELGPIFRLQFPGGRNIVCFADPESMELVHRSEGKYPVRTQLAPANFQWFYGKKNLPVPFVFLTGERWKDVRYKQSKQSTPENVYKYIPGFIKATQRLLRNISNSATADGNVINLHPLIMTWSMEASAYFTLGADLDLVENSSSEEMQKFQRGIRTLISTIDDFGMALPLFKIFPSKVTRNLEQATNDLYSIGQKYIDTYLNSNKNGQETAGESLIEQWLNEKKLSKKEAIMSSIFMFGAGVDTTPSCTTFMLYELAKHQDIQQKLYDQVTSVLGETGEADSESLQNIPYLGHVIKETLRLNPISPHHIRTLPRDIDILGYNIPAQTLLMYSMLAVAKNEKYFKDPLKFDPDRWTRDSIHPFAILPFGAGVRSCWGRRFAEIEMKILLSEVCRRYILESNEPVTKRLQSSEKLFARPGEPVNIKFIPRTCTI